MQVVQVGELSPGFSSHFRQPSGHSAVRSTSRLALTSALLVLRLIEAISAAITLQRASLADATGGTLAIAFVFASTVCAVTGCGQSHFQRRGAHL